MLSVRSSSSALLLSLCTSSFSSNSNASETATLKINNLNRPESTTQSPSEESEKNYLWSSIKSRVINIQRTDLKELPQSITAKVVAARDIIRSINIENSPNQRIAHDTAYKLLQLEILITDLSKEKKDFEKIDKSISTLLRTEGTNWVKLELEKLRLNLLSNKQLWQSGQSIASELTSTTKKLENLNFASSLIKDLNSNINYLREVASEQDSEQNSFALTKATKSKISILCFRLTSLLQPAESGPSDSEDLAQWNRQLQALTATPLSESSIFVLQLSNPIFRAEENNKMLLESASSNFIKGIWVVGTGAMLALAWATFGSFRSYRSREALQQDLADRRPSYNDSLLELEKRTGKTLRIPGRKTK
jgi:hypothetical protein